MNKPFPIPIAMFMQEDKQTQMQSLLELFTRMAMNLSLLGIILVVIYGSYVLFWPMQTLSYNNLPFPVEAVSVRRGEAIPLTISYCKANDLSEKIVGQIISDDPDKVVMTMGEKQRHLEPGCHLIRTRIWPVPADTRPGRYIAQFSISYLLFNIRTITVHSYSAPFQVVE